MLILPRRSLRLWLLPAALVFLLVCGGVAFGVLSAPRTTEAFRPDSPPNVAQPVETASTPARPLAVRQGPFTVIVVRVGETLPNGSRVFTVREESGRTGQLVVGPKAVVRQGLKRLSADDIKPEMRLQGSGRINEAKRTIEAITVVITPAGRSPAS